MFKFNAVMGARAFLSSLALGMLSLAATVVHAQDSAGASVAPKVEFVDSLVARAQQPHDLSPWACIKAPTRW